MIYHVTPSYPPRLGGLEKVVQMLAKTQNEQGLHTAVITSSQGSLAGRTIETIPIVRLRSFAFASTTIMFGLPFQLLRIRKVDNIHLHITQAFTPEIVWLIAKLKRIPYIAHIHIDAPAQGWAGFLLKIYKSVILGRVLRSAQYVIVFTHDQKQAVHTNYRVAIAKIKIIPNGVEDVFYTDASHALSAKPKLLFVGRLGYQKDLPLLFQALVGVSDKFETTLVGDGELREILMKMVLELGLHNIKFAGRADGIKLRRYYKHADIFVLSSEREGMPLVLLEAMASGLPIIATEVTGTRDVIENGKNGLLVPYGRPAAFRAALLNLTSNPELYSHLHTQGRIMAEMYSWKKIARQFSRLYKESA